MILSKSIWSSTKFKATPKSPILPVSNNNSQSKNTKRALDQFCINLNEKSKNGKIDKLVGRSAELDRTIQILCRRQKNNPLFVGDPGVGKTAIAEGLAKTNTEIKTQYSKYSKYKDSISFYTFSIGFL